MKLFDRRRFWIALGAATGGALALGVIILHALDRSERIGFLGSAFGSVVAALTALGVVEYSAHAERRAGKRIMLDLLRRVENSAKAKERPDLPRLSIQGSLWLALDQALGVAEDLRSTVPGMAAAQIYLQNLSNGLAEVDAGTKRVTDNQFERLRKHANSTVKHCREAIDCS